MRTVRRKKVFTMPEEVLALFSDEAGSDDVMGREGARASTTLDATEREAGAVVLRRVAARRGTSCLDTVQRLAGIPVEFA